VEELHALKKPKEMETLFTMGIIGSGPFFAH
jgi:hypothetical protein